MKIPKSENQYIEFKSERVSAKVFAEEVVAFANAEGGEIWLGVEDDRQITGISRSYEEDVMNICRAGVIPPLQPSYQEVVIEGAKIARIAIAKGVDRPYYTSKNRYFIRVGSTKRIASREGLIRLFQASGLFHYDLVEISGAGISQLDFSAIADYFSRYQISFASETEDEKIRLLTASDVLGNNGRPTVGGDLVFGINPEKILPQAGIAFAHFEGKELDAELFDKKNFGGSLPRQVDNALAAIKANRSVASRIQGAKRVEKANYPDKVFRELLVNAAVHRNYSIIGSQNRVFMFSDRIEFISPGRLPNTVSIEKLSVGTSFARNPLLVRLMENLGYMDRLGRGLPMVCQEAKRLKRNVLFEDSGEEFRVTLQWP
ncbi:MAG: putative DNA binding domain-containing protein [Desulfobacula sp.]|uniref:RNA-binding domain-containing protein n=1 Tax=Desulfobacula sp. TaxID=2593537 RepID=UPI0025BEB564|nr:RNA-binding domain-containing protein [Desulfobacula sp.]MCD4721406.1 putative DNA binding domain-containing protein [Desulfobacula sp.]